MKKSIFIFGFLTLLAGLLPVAASETRAGDKVIISEAMEGNLYVGTGELYIKAPVNGDVIAAGGELWIEAPIGDDVLVSGGEIHIRSEVSGDVRVAAGEVWVFGEIRGDLIVFGGELSVASTAVIHGDVKMFGGSIKFAGKALGDMQIFAGDVEFDGEAMQTLEIKARNVDFNGIVRGSAVLAAEDLTILKNASFHSDVTYWSKAGEMDLSKYLKEGASATYDEHLSFKTRLDKNFVRKGLLGLAIFRVAAAALMIVLMVSFFAPFFEKNTGNIKAHFGNYLGVGSLFLVATPFAAILAFVTVIGIPIGFIMLSGYAIALTVAHSLTAVVAAYELKQYLHREWNTIVTMAVAVAGFVVLKLVGLMAFPGQLITFVLTAIAIGAVIQWLRQGWRRQDDTPEANAGGADDDDPETV